MEAVRAMPHTLLWLASESSCDILLPPTWGRYRHRDRAFSPSIMEALRHMQSGHFARCLSEPGERTLSRCVQTTQGMPFVHVALVAKGAGGLELQGTTTIRKTVLGRPNPQGTAHPVFLEKGLFILELHLKKQTSGFPHKQQLQRHSQGM